MSLGGVEIVVSLKGLEAIDEFSIGILFGFQICQVVVIPKDRVIELWG